MSSTYSTNAIDIYCKENEVSESKNSVLHLLPCKVKCTCDALVDDEQQRCKHAAKVDEYFTPIIRNVNQGDENKQHSASFRGRPLRGVVVNVPEGYKGIVLHDTSNSSGARRRVTSNGDQVGVKLWLWSPVD